MRSFILTSVVLSIAAAAPAPAPQDIDFDLAYALPNPSYTTAAGATAQIVTYNPSSILASAQSQITAAQTDASDATSTAALEKRTACAPQPSGYGPVPSPDTPSAFSSYSVFASAASAAPTPNGYSQTFKNLQGSNNAYGYIGFTNLQTYDVNACAAKCNAINGCLAINIYYERDPTVDPGTGSSGCTNPSSTTNIKCVFWGGPVSSSNAMNTGQYRNQFQVVIAGSNGYVNNSIASPPGYGSAVPLGNAAINAPLDSYGYDSYMGSAIFTTGAFNIQLCADACSMKSAYNLANPPTDGSPVTTCQFFNTYILYINNTNNLQGQYCAMYSESWPSSYATNVGQYRGSDHFLIEYSFAYSNATNPGSACRSCAVHQASKDIVYSTLQPFCSTLLGYSTPVATVTATTTTTPLSTTTMTSVSVTSVVSTSVVTVDLKKRQDAATPSLSVLYSGTSITAIIKVAPTQTLAERGLPTPTALTKYPSAILNSACALVATPVTSTSTTTVSATVTAPTSISTQVVGTTSTSSVITTTSTTTTTSIPSPSPIPASVPCGQTVVSDGFDFHIECNVARTGGGTQLFSSTEAQFSDCLQAVADNSAAFGFNYDPTSLTCTSFYYPGNTPSNNAHYITSAAVGIVYGYCSDFLSG